MREEKAQEEYRLYVIEHNKNCLNENDKFNYDECKFKNICRYSNECLDENVKEYDEFDSCYCCDQCEVSDE